MQKTRRQVLQQTETNGNTGGWAWITFYSFEHYISLYNFNLRRILKNRKPRPPVETNTSDGFENKVLKIIDPIKREGPVLNMENIGLELKVISQRW